MRQEHTLESRTVYKGKIMTVRVHTVQLRNNSTTQREIVEHASSVTIVPMDDEGNVLLVRQYRKPAEAVLLETPAGGMDPGEEPEAAAQRELQEETGFAARELKLLSRFWLCPGYSTEYMYAYLATGLYPGNLHQEEDEDIELERVPISGITERITSGKISDAKSIASLMLALQQLGL